MTVDEVRAAAMQLDPVERAVLAAELRESLEHPDTASQAEVDDAWTSELRRRSDDLHSGHVQGRTVDEVLARLHTAITDGQ